MQLDIKQAVSDPVARDRVAQQTPEHIEPRRRAALADQSPPERRPVKIETEFLDHVGYQTAELDAHPDSVTQPEAGRTPLPQRAGMDQVQSFTTTSALKHLLRWLHDAQRSGIVSSSDYVDSKAAAIARWLHDTRQRIDHKKAHPNYVEGQTAELGKHPHTVDLNEVPMPVFAAPPALVLPVNKVSRSPGPASDPFQAGRTIRGRYVLEELIGQGGFAHIYRARDLRRDVMDGSDLHVALKVLRPELRERSGTTPRLKREFRQTQRLWHPTVVRVFDLDAHDGVWFIVMELLEGETLARRLQRLAGVPMPRPETHALLAACADALGFAHDRQIVHGDFTPTNILILNDGSFRIVDFGSSPEITADSAAGNSDSTSRVATTAYASPEVLARESAMPRDDLFSFACVAFEVVAGHHPFSSARTSVETQTSHDAVLESATVSPELTALLQQGMAWRRDDRPASVREYFQCLTTLMTADPTWQPHAEDVSTTNIALPTSPVIPAFDALPASSPIADSETPPTPVPQAPVAAAVYIDTEATPNPAVPAAQHRSHAALPPTKPTVSTVASPRRGRLYGCIALFVAAYLGFLALRGPGVELQATTATQSKTPQMVAPPSPPPPDQTPLQGTTNQLVDVTVAKPRPTSVVKPSVRSPANKPAPAVSFDTAAMTVTPRAGLAAIIVRRMNGHAPRLRVAWQLKSGTAVIGEDIGGPASGFAEFAENQQIRTLFVPLLNHPNGGGERTFSVELTKASTVVEIAPVSTVEVTILDVN